jgi:hypothetical protein
MNTHTPETPSNVIALAPRQQLAGRRFVPPVHVELLAAVTAQSASVGLCHSDGDILMSVGMTIRRLREARPIHEWGLIGVNLAARFSALLDFMARQGYGEDSVFAVLRGETPALLEAAARAPLKEREFQSDYLFDLATFQSLVREYE